MGNVSYLYLKDNFMFSEFSQNMRHEKVLCSFFILYTDSKSSLFSYHGDKTLGSPDSRCDPFFALIIILPFTCLSIIRPVAQPLAHHKWTPSTSPWCAVCRQYLATFDKLVSLVKYFPELEFWNLSGVLSDSHVFPWLSHYPTSWGKARSSHKACFFGIQIYWLLALKSNALALSVRSGLNNLLGVSNLLNVGRLTISGISSALSSL